MKAVAAISMLHETADANSATRTFRGEPVLLWTSRRVAKSKAQAVNVICWEDQAAAVAGAGGEPTSIGARARVPQIEAITAARRWADGWRGGLLNSTEFDLGFSGRTVLELLSRHNAEAAVLIDPSAALIDPALLDRLIEHARTSSAEFAFLPVAPGFGAMLLKQPVLERIAKADALPGRLLTYQPDAPMRDPLGSESCVEAPLALCRTTRRFKLDGLHRINALATETESLNGTLEGASAEQILAFAHIAKADRSLPRDVTLELCGRRLSQPCFLPVVPTGRAQVELSSDLAKRLFDELAGRDDVRLTLGLVGDPLCCDGVMTIIDLARAAGIRAIHLRTDLVPEDRAVVDAIAESGIDVVSVNLPATSPQTYREMMGADRLPEVIDNIKRLLLVRSRLGAGVPIIAPTFVKARANIAEMEAWYDQWLRALGCAVISGPSTYGGLIEDVGVGDMSPPRRTACRRIESRLTVLADGTVVACEEDPLGHHPVSRFPAEAISAIWSGRVGALRAEHEAGRWNACVLCRGCREWHKP